MRIIVDAMGGDNAPQAAVLGALDAAKDFGTEVTLVGRGEEILDIMRENGCPDLPQGMEIANADDVVDMHDAPGELLHKRKNSSMVIGLKMLADGQGDAFLSAGSTGALLTGATLIVKRIKGIRRAALGPAMPNKAVTIGIKQILGARKVRLGVFREWHRAVVRQAAYGEVTAAFPVTLLQNHPDAAIYTNAIAAGQPF